jgi:hypothetical protein
VIHEHEDMILASAAIDFGLTETETERLNRAIADCPICAERAAAYRRQFQMIAELPLLDPSESVRRVVQGSVVTGRRQQARVPWLLLAAALTIGALLALVAAAAGGAFRQKTIAELPPIGESAPPIASASPSATFASPPPVDPSEPGVVTPAALAPNSIADVISTNLRLRSQPRISADSIKFEPLMTVGDRLFVIDGPVTATNHDWYQVLVWRPANTGAVWPIGWVASADINGTPWIAGATIDCPTTPDLGQLAAMDRHVALACYGHRTLSFRGLVGGSEPVDPCPAGVAEPCLAGPTWLAGTGGWTATVDAHAATTSPSTQPLILALDPGATAVATRVPAGRMATIQGAFDDPASASCKLQGSPASVSTLTVTDAVLRCRSTFVISSIVPAPAGLDVQTAAITVTSGLRVRSLPLVDDSSVRYEPLLDQGTRLFVLDGPVLGSGYDWFRVIAPTVTRSDGQPMVGWVAVAAKTGEVWTTGVDLGCPAADGSVSVADLARLGSGAVTDGGISCFGAAPISTTATIALTCTGPDATATSTINWLGIPARMTVRLTGGGSSFDARVHPDLAGRTACGSPAGGSWVVRGHFEDPAAESCAGGAAIEEGAQLARYRCGSIFVVTDLAPATP